MSLQIKKTFINCATKFIKYALLALIMTQIHKFVQIFFFYL